MAKDITVLLIEDDNLLIRMYQDKFEQEGYKVNTASNGEDGLVKMREEKPSLIVLDVMMPKMNGFETLKKIKADTDYKDIPVVLLTNLNGENDAEKGIELGAVTYLIKSENTPKTIAKKITGILEASTRDKQLPSDK